MRDVFEGEVMNYGGINDDVQYVSAMPFGDIIRPAA